MAFADQVKRFSTTIAKRVSHVESLEATKNSLVLPFFQLLGYDIFDPTEVIPEYMVNAGTERGGKVDYALIHSGQPAILVECKPHGSALNRADESRLNRIITDPGEGFGLLTNGTVYGFYAYSEQLGVTSPTPFLEFDILELTEPQAEALQLFTKSYFSQDRSLARAFRLKSKEAIRNQIAQELADPSDGFVRCLLKQLSSRSITRKRIEQFRPIVREVLREFVGDYASPQPTPLLNLNEPPSQHAAHSTELTGWTPLSRVSDVTHIAPPSMLRFSDGEERAIDSWRAVLCEVTKWLFSKGHISVADLPIRGDSSGFTFINSVARSPSGQPYLSPRQVTDGVFLELQYNAETLLSNSKKMLTHCSICLETVHSKFR